MPSSRPKGDKPASPESARPWRIGAIAAWLLRYGLLWQARDLACARWLHRATVWPLVLKVFRLVSALADGLLWLLVFACLALWGGPSAAPCMVRLLGMSAFNLLVYKVCKQGTGRPRPFQACPDVHACTRTLDEFSFPSGHTLHTVAFGIVLSAYYPSLSWPWGLFAVLVALSRLILGLHYPSDVLMGALIGGWSAWATLHLF